MSMLGGKLGRFASSTYYKNNLLKANFRGFASGNNAPVANTSTTSADPAVPISKEEAQSRARALLDLLPGETAFSKTAYATMGAGLTAFLITKGIYVPNDETLILAAFAVTLRALYNKLSRPFGEYLDASIKELRDRWMISAVNEKRQVIESIAEMEGFRDHGEVTAAFYATRRENLIMQAELTELRARNQFLSGIKQRLDEAVRRERERETQERRARVEAIVAGLNAALKEPKTQEAVLKKCLADLEKMESRPIV